jgi:outer membrane protein
MTIIKPILITFFFFSFVVSSSAQMRILTLEEAIANTLQKNYDIQLSRNDSTIAAIDYSYRNSLFLPRINGTASTVWNNNNTKQTLADGSHRESNGLKSNNISSQVALNWTLFDGLRMFATYNKAQELLHLGELEIKNQVVNTVAQVVNNYYNIVRQKQQLRALDTLIAIDSERVRLAQYRLDVGVGTRPELLQSKIDLNTQKSDRLLELATIEQLKEQLNQAMNVSQFTNYDVTDSIDINTALTLGEVLNNAQRNDPLMLIDQKQIDIANLTLKEQKAGLWPTINFVSNYNFNRNKNQKVINSFSTLFNQTKGFNYGVTATVPIFNGLNQRRLIKQAKWDIQYSGLVLENQKSVTALSVINSFQAYEQQKASLLLEEESIILARENLDIVFQAYKLGAATLIQQKLAQQTLQDTYSRVIAARYNTKVAETELLRLSGVLVR